MSSVGDAHGEVLLLEPVFVPKLWGGSRLRDWVSTPLPEEPIGECLVISAHPRHDCVVREGRYAGLTLSGLWADRRELFGGVSGERLPVQVKLIDATSDLSIQVHPTTAFASQHGCEGAKNECWYVLEPPTGGVVQLGHHARTAREFADTASDGRWDALMREREMRAGDFFWVPAGTPHCLRAGSVVYEVLQSSDVTYRLHDHDRCEATGRRRELHFTQGLATLTVPDLPQSARPIVREFEGGIEARLIDNRYFSVSRLSVQGAGLWTTGDPYLLVSALEGAGTVNGTPVGRGDHFVVTRGLRVDVTGVLTLMVTAPRTA